MTGISVVIPTKDRLKYLRRAVPMFLSHAEVEEVIIVIDGCRDQTIDYVKTASVHDKRVRYVDNHVNRGLPYSRNKGIELAKCEYVFTGEDDLEISDDFFTTLLKHMQETEADIIAGRNIFKFEDETSEEAIDRTNQTSGHAIDRRLIMVQTGIRALQDQEQALLPAPMLARTQIFRKLRFDESYRGISYREESDFQLTAREHGYKLIYCPHAISFNLMIENDRGGVHSLVGTKRVGCIIRNNWHFERKHHELITREFETGNPYFYIAKFALRQVLTGILLPVLVQTKRRMLTSMKGS